MSYQNVKLAEAKNIDFSKLASFEDMTLAAENSDLVKQLEGILIQWYKQIDQVGVKKDC